MANTSSTLIPHSPSASQRARLKDRLLRAVRYDSPDSVGDGTAIAPVPKTHKDDPDVATLDFLYAGVEKQLEAQVSQAGALDTKAGLVLGSASLLTAAATALQAALTSQVGFSVLKPWVYGVEFAALVFYVFIVISALMAYGIRNYKGVPNPATVRDLLFEDAIYVKRKLLATMASSYRKNAITINHKVWWTRASLTALFGEGVLLALSAFLRILM